MSVLGSTSVSGLFSAITQRSANMAAQSGNALSSGISRYQKGDAAGAIREFRRAAALSPGSDNAVKAYEFMATAYLKMGDTANAVSSYQSLLSISPNRTDVYLSIGNIYFDQGDYDSALRSYQEAVRRNPNDVNSLFSLGQAYNAKGLYRDAEQQFLKISAISPDSYGSYYGLGQTYYLEGDFEKAVSQFKSAIGKKGDFLNAYLEMGYAYADIGKTDEAYELVQTLAEKNVTMAATLNAYIYKVSKPEMVFAYGANGFYPTQGPGTKVASLASGLATSGASQQFTMEFIFSKQMDIASVEDISKWMISRADHSKKGGAYNWGTPVPSTEVAVPFRPDYVIYDRESRSANVVFTITQNDTGDGTIDPSHIIFRFFGMDSLGNGMNPSADEYGGISKFV